MDSHPKELVDDTEPAAGAASPSLENRTLGDFILRERIEEGGFAVVYRAEQPLLGREVVVKVLKRSHSQDQTLIGRFLREARVASRLDHPYAAHIYSFGAEPDGLLWIAMELVRGMTLENLLREQGPLPLVRFVPLLERVCEVVHTAHQQGIVHRDLKPSNVMVLWRAGKLLPKLLDFGVARLAGELEGPPAALTTYEGPAPATELTQRGQIVGTPPYMAPEQWRDAVGSDSRTDLYALGVMSYECLVGRRPFGGTLRELMVAHGRAKVPPLPPELPAALHEVIAKAMAKTVEARFDNALAFAAAFRAASGLEADPEQLPPLDSSVKEAFLAEGPQPLAESIAQHEAARTPTQAWEALGLIVRAVVRLLGVFALSARTRLPDERVSPEVDAALGELRQGTLSDEGWLALARSLLGPYAARREAHPIPDLVTCLFVAGEETATDASRDLDALLVLGRDERDDEGALRELLEAGVAHVNGVLKALFFLCEHTLAVSRGSHAERWVGVRRPRRAPAILRGTCPPEGQAFLIDPAGVPVLLLAPLLQALVPSPGAPEELFFFDGAGRYGARLLSLPLLFERHDAELWTWYAEHLHAGEAGTRVDAGEERAPYRGLAPFTASDADLFFGREREAEAFVNRLRVHPFLAVVGPSGSGKSSFIQAGVLPALAPAWRAIVIRPGPAPLAALAAAVGVTGVDAEALRRDPAALGRALRQLSASRQEKLILVVDQFEELLTLCGDPEEQLRYAEALTGAARSSDDPLRVIVTLRDDFLIRVQQLAPLRDRLAQGLELLGTPAAEDLARILVEPAKHLGYELEDAALVTEIVAQVTNLPGALALLSFTASRLWEQRDRHFHRLTRRAYEQIGGVGGALGQHAEETLAALGAQDQPLVRQAFRHLVTAAGTRAVLTRRELLELLGGGAAAERVLERLIAARLLVAREGPHEDNVEVIHEALLASWPRLVRWQREDADSARLRDQIRSAARQWHERGRPRGMLWRGEPLVEYRLWRGRYPGALTEAEEAFGAASLRDEARTQRTKRILLGAAFLALTAGVVGLYRTNQETQRQRALAVKQEGLARASAAFAQERLAALYEEQGRLAGLAGDPMRAIAFLDAALREGAGGPALQLLVGTAAQRLAGQIVVYEQKSAVYSIDLAPDGRLAVTGARDGSAVVWDAATGKALHVLSEQGKAVRAARFAGPTVLIARTDGALELYDAATGRLLHHAAHGAFLEDVAIHGRTLATAGDKGTIELFGLDDGKVLSRLGGGTADVMSVAFDPSGTHLATGDAAGTIRLFDLGGGGARTIANAHAGLIIRLVFSPNGRLLASAGFDGNARVWDVEAGRAIGTITHKAEVRAVAFDPTGAHVASGANDRAVKIWSVAKHAEVVAIETSAPVLSVAFHRRGDRLLTTTEDGLVRMWDAASGAAIASFLGHGDAVWEAAFDASGARLATASHDGTARIWDATREDRLALPGHAGNVWSLSFSPDGTRAVTAADDGVARVFTIADGRLVLSLQVPMAEYGQAAYDAAGRRIAVGGQTVTIFDAASGRATATLPDEREVTALDWSPVGDRLATGGHDGSLRLWDATGALVRAFDGHAKDIWSVAFSPDGKKIVTASEDATVRVWDVESGRPLHTFKSPLRFGTAVFSPDGKRIATGGQDRLIRIWDAETGASIAAFEGHTSLVSTVEYSPDGRFLASAAHDGTVRIWDAATGRHLMNVAAQDGAFFAARWDATGTHVGASSRGAAAIWPLPSAPMTKEQVSRLVACRVPPRLRVGSSPTPATCPDR